MKKIILATVLAFTLAPLAHAAEVSNDAILYTQEGLRQHGYTAVPVDGVWGPETTEALKSFQQSSNLEATGTPDVTTLTALNTQAAANFGGSETTVGSSESLSDVGSNAPLENNMGTGQPNVNANGY